MVRLLLQWLLSAASLTILARLLPGFHVRNFSAALTVAAVYGILQVVLYRIFAIIAFIPILLTFGLFTFVIDAFLLFLADRLLEDFKIDNFLITLVAAVLLTIMDNIWRWLLF